MAYAPPYNLYPAAGKNVGGNGIRFTWLGQTSPLRYFFELNTDANFGAATRIFYNDIGTDPFKSLDGFQNDGKIYYWRVKAGDGYSWSTWASEWFVNGLGTVILAQPAIGANISGTSITFGWKALSGATYYELEVNTDSLWGTAGGSCLFPRATVGNVTSKIVSGFRNDGTTYYWRVWASNGPYFSVPSAGWIVNGTGVPAVPSSPNPVALQIPKTSVTFSWGAVSQATKYMVEVNSDPNWNTASRFYYKEVGNITSVVIGGFPIVGTIYYWRVWAGNTKGWGTPATGWFQNGNPKPAIPALETPANYARVAGTSLIFEWERPIGAAGFVLEVNRDPYWHSAGRKYQGSVGNVTSVTLSGFLNDGETYYWRVSASNAAGDSGFGNSRWQFINGAPAPPSIQTRILAAKQFIDTLYQTDGTYGFLKEHPGFPLAIIVNGADLRLSGDMRYSNYTIPTWWGKAALAQVSGLVANPVDDAATIAFDDTAPSGTADYKEPVLKVTRKYGAAGIIYYTVTFISMAGGNSVDLYFAGQLVGAGITQNTLGNQSRTYVSSGTPCNRYTVRHGSALAHWLYLIWGDTTKAIALNNLRLDYGFRCDIYDPLFGQGQDLPDDYQFTHAPYQDTRDTWRQLPRYENPSVLPYLSKIQVEGNISLDAYITTSRGDPLLNNLNAIHMLTKYNDPNRKFNSNSWSPLTWAKSEWSNWNGVGIPSPAGDSSYASGVRTGTYLALCTLLGYKYGDSQCRSYANMIYNGLVGEGGVQAGLYPLYPGYVYTDKNGMIYRPNYQGGFYAVWGQPRSFAPAITDQGKLTEILDNFGMPSEEPGPIPCNQEATHVMLQALRIYAYYALGISYPNNKYIPLVGAAPPLDAPRITTSSVSKLTPTSATLHGNVDDMGSYSSISVGFQYGLNTNYGTNTSRQTWSGQGVLSINITGLKPATTYHYRMIATAGNLTVLGDDRSFTTPSKIAPTIALGSVSSITPTSAVLNATVSSMGQYSSFSLQFAYETWIVSQGYDYFNPYESFHSTGAITISKTGPVSVKIDNLIPNKPYGWNILVILDGERSYVAAKFSNFSTLRGTELVTDAPTGITNTSAEIGGRITNIYQSPVKVKVAYGKPCGIDPVFMIYDGGNANILKSIDDWCDWIEGYTNFTITSRRIIYGKKKFGPTVKCLSPNMVDWQEIPQTHFVFAFWNCGSTSCFGEEVIGMDQGIWVPSPGTWKADFMALPYGYAGLDTPVGGFATNQACIMAHEFCHGVVDSWMCGMNGLKLCDVKFTTLDDGQNIWMDKGRDILDCSALSTAANRFDYKLCYAKFLNQLTPVMYQALNNNCNMKYTSEMSMSGLMGFKYTITGLSPGTFYSFQAEGMAEERVYCEWIRFRTTGARPTLSLKLGSGKTCDGNAGLLPSVTSMGDFSSFSMALQYWCSGGTVYTTEPWPVTKITNFGYNLKKLTPNTTWYVKAIAISGGLKIAESSTISFFEAESPDVIEYAPTVSGTTATFSAKLTKMGTGSSVQVDFVCEAMIGGSIIDKSTPVQTLTAPGPFTATITELNPNTTYHVAASAYGDTRAYRKVTPWQYFTTGPAPCKLTTNAANSVAPTSANLVGTVSSFGSYSQLLIGFEWGLTTAYGNQTPTVVINKTTTGLTIPITGLSPKTTYHYRMIAGDPSTRYLMCAGADVAFTTGALPMGNFIFVADAGTGGNGAGASHWIMQVLDPAKNAWTFGTEGNVWQDTYASRHFSNIGYPNIAINVGWYQNWAGKSGGAGTTGPFNITPGTYMVNLDTGLLTSFGSSGLYKISVSFAVFGNVSQPRTDNMITDICNWLKANSKFDVAKNVVKIVALPKIPVNSDNTWFLSWSNLSASDWAAIPPAHLVFLLWDSSAHPPSYAGGTWGVGGGGHYRNSSDTCAVISIPLDWETNGWNPRGGGVLNGVSYPNYSSYYAETATHEWMHGFTSWLKDYYKFNILGLYDAGFNEILHMEGHNRWLKQLTDEMYSSLADK